MVEQVAGRVSVIIATRNSAATLGALLESIQAQDYPDVQVVVVDNHSSDGTPGLAREFADAVISAGPERSAQRNRGVDESNGEFVLILDSDMVLEATVISECVSRQKETGAVAIVIPERTVGDGWLARVRALERSCYVGDTAVEAARFFTRAAFVGHGGYDTELTGVEDWDLPARMRRDGATQARIDVFIDHDESGARLWPHLRKKFYYAQTALPYLRRHRALASKQAVLLRPAFLRHWKRLIRQPVLASELVVLKVAETGAVAAGVASALIRSR